MGQEHFYLQMSSVDDQIFWLSGIDGIYSYVYIVFKNGF